MFLFESDRQIRMIGKHFVIDLNRPGDPVNRVGGIAALQVDRPPEVKGVGMAWISDQDQSVEPVGLLQPAGLVMGDSCGEPSAEIQGSFH
jgi:hypothetical protein